MTIKIFTVNEDGKINLTKEELEKLLQEAEEAGYQRGKAETLVTIGNGYPYSNMHGYPDRDYVCVYAAPGPSHLGTTTIYRSENEG